MLLPSFSFGQLTEPPKETAPFISATPSIYDTYLYDTPNPASRSAICTDPTVIKYVNVNIHFIQNDGGGNNFTSESDGQGNYNYTGYDRANDLVNNMNAQFNTNAQMNLPCGNTTAVLPIRIQYVLKGVYFYRSSDYSNDGVGDWNVHSNLRKNPNTEINIYHIHYPNIPYAGGTADGVASTLGGSTNLAVKIWKDYQGYLTGGSWITSWETAKLLNHEVAHNLGLRHAWSPNGNIPYGDYCSDTPLNNNCWYTNPTAPCSTWCSNNLMDYNANKSAVTPCQINTMHTQLNTGANPYVNSCDACMPTNAFFYLPKTMCLASNKTKILFDGRGSWKETDYQIEIYQVAGVGSGTQVGNTYHISSYTGNAGKLDLRTIYNFQLGKVYQVRLITHNTCGGHASVNWITIAPTIECVEEEEPGGSQPGSNIGGKIVYIPSTSVARKAEMVQIDEVTTTTEAKTLILSPNPAQNFVQLTYDIQANESYQLSLKSMLGEQLAIIEQGRTIEHEKRNLNFDISRYASGMYLVVLVTETGITTKQLIITK